MQQICLSMRLQAGQINISFRNIELRLGNFSPHGKRLFIVKSIAEYFIAQGEGGMANVHYGGDGYNGLFLSNSCEAC